MLRPVAPRVVLLVIAVLALAAGCANAEPGVVAYIGPTEITEDQLDSLVSHQGARLGEGTLTVTAQDLVNQRRWRRSSPDLLLELRRAMGEATAVTFDLR